VSHDQDGARVGLDTSVPNVARVYDYLLGGKDIFAADRQLGDQLLTEFPQSGWISRQNRAFLGRAVRYCADQGAAQSVGRIDLSRPVVVESERASSMYKRASAPMITRPREEIAALFSGLELVEPGLAFTVQWRAPVEFPRPGRAGIYAGVGRKP
jgi:hypothetical protein